MAQAAVGSGAEGSFRELHRYQVPPGKMARIPLWNALRALAYAARKVLRRESIAARRAEVAALTVGLMLRGREPEGRGGAPWCGSG